MRMRASVFSYINCINEVAKKRPPPPKKKKQKKKEEASPKTKRTWTVSKKNEVKYLHWRSNLHFVENFFYPVYRFLDYFFLFFIKKLIFNFFFLFALNRLKNIVRFFFSIPLKNLNVTQSGSLKSLKQEKERQQHCAHKPCVLSARTLQKWAPVRKKVRA